MIKLFEKFKKVNLKTRIERNKTDLISGMYIIFLSDRFNWTIRKNGNTLILGQIRIVEYEENSQYAQIVLLDFVSEIEQDIELLDVRSFNVKSIEKLYTTPSLTDAKRKFDELLKQQPYYDWKINNDANKYNI